jgi:3-dehydroquinate dehydratase
VATAVIMGLGPDGYPTAMAAMVRLLDAHARGAARV